MSSIIMLIPMVVIILWMSRTQKKRATERQEQLNSISKGDEVVTIGGLYGVIDEIDTVNGKMVLDCEGVFLTFELSALKRVLQKEEVAVSEETSSASDTAFEE